MNSNCTAAGADNTSRTDATTTNAQMSGQLSTTGAAAEVVVPSVQPLPTQPLVVQSSTQGHLDDDGTLNIDEEYTKSLLTPAPNLPTTTNKQQQSTTLAAVHNQNHSNSTSLIINENSTSNDETLTMGSVSKAVVNNNDLNLELNQLVEELIESVVGAGGGGGDGGGNNTHIEMIGDVTSNDAVVESLPVLSTSKTTEQHHDLNADLDTAVREVLSALLDQIEARLMENRALEQDEKSTTSQLGNNDKNGRLESMI